MRPNLVIGFAAETNSVEKNAKEKLNKKNCDWIISNDVSNKDIGFNSDYNEVIIHYKYTKNEKLSYKKAIKKDDKSEVTIGPSESMSKSKRNTIDPETMIESYGADAVRWFILSDSPPEKDVQWSDNGVVSSSKFLQKIWNLNNLIKKRKETKISKKRAYPHISSNNFLSIPLMNRHSPH